MSRAVSPDSDEYDAIMTSLTVLIRRSLQTASSEQRHPGMSADDSDDIIKDSIECALTLRRMRAEFEIIMTGAILPSKQRSGGDNDPSESNIFPKPGEYT